MNAIQTIKTIAVIRAHDVQRHWLKRRRNPARWARWKNTSRNLVKKVRQNKWLVVIVGAFCLTLNALIQDFESFQLFETKQHAQLVKNEPPAIAAAAVILTPSIPPETAPGAEVGLNLKLSTNLSSTNSQELNP
jgi:hypothetical protein